MSADLDLILGKIENLSREDLVTLRRNIDDKLQRPLSNSKSNGNGSDITARDAKTLPENWQTMVGTNGLPMYGKWGNIGPGHPDYISLPGVQPPTSAAIEQQLAAIFTPEELAAMDKVDLNKLPSLEKPLSHYLLEDREDSRY